jgi:Zn-dependent protease
VAILALVAKLKALLLFLPKIKLLATAGTALVSVAAYSLIWGWEFAAGFVVLIFIHEMGHVFALRRHGIKASAPMFVPFMGAVIWARSLGDDALTEARVGLAGPYFGAAASAIVAIVGLATHTGLLEALGYIGFLLNLFNLLPVVPLDGGRAMAAMAPWMWFIGFGALVTLEFIEPNPILLIICLVAAYDLYHRWQKRNSPTMMQTAYYRVAPRSRILIGAAYLGLIVALALGMHFTYVHRAIPA